MSASSVLAKPTIGIISLGEMGLGIAKVLRSHNYPVFTVTKDRSQATIDRVREADVNTSPSDEDFVAKSDIILSIVPPRHAVATAKRVVEACHTHEATTQRAERKNTAGSGQAPSLVFVDLNAISPRTVRGIGSMMGSESSRPKLNGRKSTNPVTRTFSFRRSDSVVPIGINFIDGAIIGPPPKPKDGSRGAQPSSSSSSSSSQPSWKMPSLILSGPKIMTEEEAANPTLPSALMTLLNMKVVSDKIGKASALKSCFASLTKGMTALSILSFTTAHNCQLLPDLISHLQEFSPATLELAKKGLTGMPPKAYRWVDEMRQIGETFQDEGGFYQGAHGEHSVFGGIADIYDLVANNTILGQETTEKRKRGTTAEDVAECVSEGIIDKKRKSQGGEKLDMAWRGSWS